MIDTTYGDGGDTEVEIVDGGINHKFVEVRLNSEIGKGLKYMIMAYSDRHTDLNRTHI